MSLTRRMRPCLALVLLMALCTLMLELQVGTADLFVASVSLSATAAPHLLNESESAPTATTAPTATVETAAPIATEASTAPTTTQPVETDVSTTEVQGRVLTPPPTPGKLAYMLYATNSITACSALIMADSIRRLGTPASMDVAVLVTGSISQTIHDALTAGGLVVIPVASWRQPSAPHDTWVESLTKLRIFEEHGYDRVIYLDSDAWLHRNLDHLFYLGEAVFWAPRAYWLDQPFIASTLLVLTPSNALFRRLEKTVAENPGKEMYDMDALNTAFKNEYGMLPSHYVFLNSEVNNDKTFGFASVDERINKTYVHHYSMMDNGGYGKPWRMNRYAIARRPEWHPLFYKLFEMYYERQDALCHF